MMIEGQSVTWLFNVRNWHWIVNGDESKAWSSSKGSYVTEYPKDAVTRIDSEHSLSDVLRPHGLNGPHVSQQDYADAIQALIDTTAKSKGYASGIALAGYSTSTIPQWADEANAFIAWRDNVWVHAFTELAKVQEGEREQPSIREFIAELPPS